MRLKDKGADGDVVGPSGGGGAQDDDDHGGETAHRSKDGDEEALARAEELKKSAEAKRALRQANLAPDRPDASFFKTLDSSIKRNTAVIKKLKQINEEQREGLLEELRVVNLSKFVSEAVTAILDAKLKSSDINAAVQVCSLLHQRYKDFAPTLLAGLLKVFFPAKGDEIDGDRSLRAMKKRSTLRLLMELYFCGVFEDGSLFVSIIKDLTSNEHLKDRETTQTNLSLLVSFARQGRGLLGLSLNGQDGQEELYKELSVTADQKKHLRKLFQSFLDAVVELLQTEHGALRQLEVENVRMLNAKGELSEENATAYEKLRKSYEHLFRNISSLAEAMDTQPPVTPEDGHTTRVITGDDGASQVAGKEPASPEPIWDDEDTRSFYESLPDLRAFVPAVLLGESEPKGVAEASQKAAEQGEPEQTAGLAAETPDVILETETQALETLPTALDDKSTSSANEKPKDKEKDDKDRIRDPEKEKLKEKGKDGEKKIDKETEKEKVKGAEGASLDSLLQRLPGCVSRDLIDQLTVDFCYLNSKSSRKKLVRTLFNVPRSSLELIPYYSRMIATLSTCMKDVAPMILQLLEEEFNFLMNKKDQMNIETKIRNIRFLGELAKFKVASPGLVFSCLKSCLDDFTHHNIDVACNLLETCGRFLYRFPETSLRMGNMLEIIMRLKNVKNLDARHSTLVENAYYQCKPPERSARVSKARPPLHQYIRKLLFADLDKTTIERVLRQLRKLPWSECESYLLKCFMKVYKGKYSQVHLIASLTAGLSRYHDAFAVAVVDEVLEAIRVGLELNEYGMQQRRIAYMRFLGELYSYRLIDSPVIFDTLYLIIGFGHGTSEQDVLDPPEDCFRLRMVITLLETCGQFFDRGSSKRRLDRFLLYFQRYVLSKGVIPLDVEFDLQDLFADLRPKMVRYATYDEANQALLELEEIDRNLAASEKERNSRPSNTTTQTDGEVYAHNQGSEYGKDAQTIGASPLGTRATGVHGTGLVDDGDSESETESGSMEADGQEEEEELEEDKYAFHDDEGDDELEAEDLDGGIPDTAGSEEEEKVKLTQKKLPESDPAEEAEFDREYRALMQESIDSRKLEMRSRPALNMTIPLNLFDSKDHGRGGGTDVESGDEVVDDPTSGGTTSSVQFRVLVKKGNKQQTKQLRIPRDCSLVLSTKQKEAAELEEKQDIKRLVLEYNERDEEDRAGAAVQPMNWQGGTAGGARLGGAGAGGGSGRGGGQWGDGGGAGRVGNTAARQRRPIAAGRRR